MERQTQCKNFVQNAWKKDLCSNCFKGKEDHVKTSVNLTQIILQPAKEGILKNVKTNGRTNKANKVLFPSEECTVIGYGGEDNYSDDDDDVVRHDFTTEATEDEVDNEEDKAFQQLTKTNTDFNSIPENLQQPKNGESKKIVEPLKLGKKQLDGKGNKKTLLVSVTPFGSTTKQTSTEATKTELSDKINAQITPKSAINIVSTANDNTIIHNIKNTQLNDSDVGNCKQIKRSQPLDKNAKYRLNRDKCEEDSVTKDEEIKSYLDTDSKDKLTTSEKVLSLMEKAKKKVTVENSLKFNVLSSKKVNLVTKPNNNVSIDLYRLKTSDEEVKNVEEKVEEVKEQEVVVAVVDSVCNDVLLPNVSSLHSSTIVVTNTEDVVCDEQAVIEVPVKQDEPEIFCSYESLKNFEKIMAGEEITLFSADVDVVLDKDDKLLPVSREQVGEPDGKADSDDLSEPPALPMSPPPSVVDARTSFLHGLTMCSVKKIIGEKPKLPVKPTLIHSYKNKNDSINDNVTLIYQKPVEDHYSTDTMRTPKRQAPKPPSPKEGDEDSTPVKVTTTSRRGRRSKSSDNLLGLVQNNDVTFDKNETIPEPTPRRSLSLSQESLVSSGIGEVKEKKKSNRGRFSLRKFLHLGKGNNKELQITGNKNQQLEHFTPPPVARPRPRLEIIHPFDLTGTRVEVVPPVRPAKSRRCSSSASSSSGENRESDIPSDSSASQSLSSSNQDSQTAERPKKPPPPPRNQSLDSWKNNSSNNTPDGKPVRPPPPRTSDWTVTHPSSTYSGNYYANLGEVRSGLAPNKPVRTASLRDCKLETVRRQSQENVGVSAPEDSGYDSFEVSLNTVVSTMPIQQQEENVYECVQVCHQQQQQQQRSSSPECDSITPGSPNYTNKLKCTTTTTPATTRVSLSHCQDIMSDYAKFKFMRSVSYCGSETESDIYSPYGFCGSELGEDDSDLSPTSGRPLRMSRLKMKKGRSVVHKNLEDNYGAVIVANHEALAQVVEQVQRVTIPPHLRSLASVDNLRWTDFTVIKDTLGVVTDRRVFYSAVWGLHPVTLCLTSEQGLHSKGTFSINTITEFCDLVPASYLPMLMSNDNNLIQASISVLSRLRVETLQTYGSNVTGDDLKKESNFVLLQVINALKSLQAEGIEEAPMNLSNMLLCREDKDPQPRLCMFQNMNRSYSDGGKGSLCQCAMITLLDILPRTPLTDVIADILRQEKAVSLSQAKSILEFSLWGPADVAFVTVDKDRELSFQRWLDLERATVLHGLVRTRAELTVFEEWHLIFLVRTNAKILAEASALLNSQVITNDE